jgi:hypothetical protein
MTSLKEMKLKRRTSVGSREAYVLAAEGPVWSSSVVDVLVVTAVSAGRKLDW